MRGKEGTRDGTCTMAFAGAEKLLDFAQAFDVGMLDQIVTAFYAPGGDPTTVRHPAICSRRGRKQRGRKPRAPPEKRAGGWKKHVKRCRALKDALALDTRRGSQGVALGQAGRAA